MSEHNELPPVPWSVEAEQAVLGCVLLDNSAAHRLTDTNIKADQFYNAAHGQIWTVTSALITAGKPADVITVATALGDKAEACGGMAYLHAMAASVFSTAHVRQYAAIVVDMAQRRALLAAGDQVQALAREAGEPAVLLDRAQSLLMALQRRDARSAPVNLLESITARTERWEAMGNGTVAPGMRTRLPRLDRALGGGLQRGRVVVIAARPSIGKTSLGVQIGLNVAGDHHRVLVLSQEMPRGDLTDRITANLGRIPLETLATGIPPDDHETWHRVVDATEMARTLSLEIDDQPALTLLAIRSKAQMVKARRGLDVLVLDYLQLCAATNPKASRHHQIEEISRGLKTLAKELDICVVVLSQINRDVAKADREPTLADLKESGAIEEDADVVLLLHPKGELDNGAQLLVAILAKNRQGKKDRIALRFDGAYQRWGECDMDVSQQPTTNPRKPHDTGL
ncbi:DnaB-like helicase C-terminal domain-containing protein [Aquabacterium sp.]|uniref:replicative DNA helicase n=1 Tax=Aquabacterium sp. TaxID=1872578 RepID=UPI00248991FC|nr:DnaB-like helicase C-terminal domain-containing protein [Aquabacterium sp.]MDI1260243.1 DnaB-like helicase C-terminal domain-containing protein [Aquabacterium sp.]